MLDENEGSLDRIVNEAVWRARVEEKYKAKTTDELKAARTALKVQAYAFVFMGPDKPQPAVVEFFDLSKELHRRSEEVAQDQTSGVGCVSGTVAKVAPSVQSVAG